MDKLRVLHVCSASIDSGAFKGAIALHDSMQGSDKVESRFLGQICSSNTKRGIYSYYGNNSIKNYYLSLLNRLDQLILKGYVSKKNDLFSNGKFGVKLNKHPLFQWADIIHLHWINQGFLSTRSILTINKPIIWTLRDMWPLTGGCHVNFSCSRFTNECGKCPALGSFNQNDISYKNKILKSKFLKYPFISWIALSNWMLNQALSANVKNENISLIPNVINRSIFKFSENSISTKVINEINILVGAANLREKYKGFEFVINALNKIDFKCKVHTFGASTIKRSEIKHKIFHHGFIDDQNDLADLFRSTDIFFAPSLVDSFGKTVAEAQMCGIPTIAFEDTGPADIIEHKITGYLSKYADLEDLVAGLNYAIAKEWSAKEISEITQKKFNTSKIVDSHIKLYKSQYVRFFQP